MLYDLSNEYQKQDFISKVKALLEGNKLPVVELKKINPQRTRSQNAYLHVILGYFASQTGYSIDEVKHDFFKKECNPELFYRERVNVKGNTVRYLRSSADLDTAEMTLAIQRFRNWSSAKAGIYLPDANEKSFLTYCEQEMERFKEYG